MSGSHTIGAGGCARKATVTTLDANARHLRLTHEAPTFEQEGTAIAQAWRHVLHGVDLALAVDGLPDGQAGALHRMRRTAVLLAGERRPLRAVGPGA